MKSSLFDRNLVRQYLLGRLDDDDNNELENELSEEILTNDELSEAVDSIEEEIIEDYLDGTLDVLDKTAVEDYFLRSPQRKTKLKFARLLRHHFETKLNHSVDPKYGALVATQSDARFQKGSVVPIDHKWSTFLIYGQIAALVLLSVLSLTYISSIRKKQSIAEHALVIERSRLRNQTQEVQPTDSSIVALTLATDRSRGTRDHVPRLDIKPSTQRILIDVALQDGGMRSYNVRLETAEGGQPIWSATLFPIRSPSGDARLLFDIPAQKIQSGDYSVVVSTIGPAQPGSAATVGSSGHYDFEVRYMK